MQAQTLQIVVPLKQMQKDRKVKGNSVNKGQNEDI